MKDLRTLDTDILIEMLGTLTGEYTDKMAQMNKGELSQYEYEIAMIQGELNSRTKKEIPRSETKRIFDKIRSILPVWNRYFVPSKLSKNNKPKPGFSS